MKNVVGDIAGQFKTLKALLAKMPEGELLSLGDPNDRGPDSKSVIEFLMQNGRTLNSNHAHMLVEAWYQSAHPGYIDPYYHKEVLFNNGGVATLGSYDVNWKEKINFEYYQVGFQALVKYENKLHELIPKEHIDFLKNCPMYIEEDNYIFTHAPVPIDRTLEEACILGVGFTTTYDQDSNYSLLWNRYVPERPNKSLNGKINIFGHNSSTQVKVFCKQYPMGWKVTNDMLQGYLKQNGSGDIWGICIDTSGVKILTGLHLPTLTIYQQEYIDE